jgi:hypothetical protein
MRFFLEGGRVKERAVKNSLLKEGRVKEKAAKNSLFNGKTA